MVRMRHPCVVSFLGLCALPPALLTGAQPLVLAAAAAVEAAAGGGWHCTQVHPLPTSRTGTSLPHPATTRVLRAGQPVRLPAGGARVRGGGRPADLAAPPRHGGQGC